MTEKSPMQAMIVNDANFYYDGVKKGSVVEIEGTPYIRSTDIASHFGLELNWDGDLHAKTKGVKVYLDDKLIGNGQLINGNTVVSIKNLFESMGYSVKWNDTKKAVYIVKE